MIGHCDDSDWHGTNYDNGIDEQHVHIIYDGNEHDTDDNNENNEMLFAIGEHMIIPGSEHVSRNTSPKEWWRACLRGSTEFYPGLIHSDFW